MVNIHSEAFEEFIKQSRTKGHSRMQGYNPKLLELIYPEELNEIEQLLIELFNNGDIETAIFLPKLNRVNGIELLKLKLKLYKKPCYAYIECLFVLYDNTSDESYLDKITQIMDYDDEDERMNAVMVLLRCAKGEKLYNVFKKGCLEDDDELVRSRCAVGMLYYKNIITNPLRIEILDKKWKNIKISLYDKSAETRKEAVAQFERLTNS